MRLFLDSSVLLAACGRTTGASHFVLMNASQFHWDLFASSYVVSEIEANVGKLGAEAVARWQALKPALALAPDILTIPWPTVFAPAKDRPVLFSAAACADVLLTLDRRDFLDLLGGEFYGLTILKPGDFLVAERERGRI